MARWSTPSPPAPTLGGSTWPSRITPPAPPGPRRSSTTTRGEPVAWALAMPVMALGRPAGPLTRATPGPRVTLAQPSAANTAVCSWSVRTTAIPACSNPPGSGAPGGSIGPKTAATPCRRNAVATAEASSPSLMGSPSRRSDPKGSAGRVTLMGAMSLDLTWQPSLLDAGPEPAIDPSFSGAVRIDLDQKSWIERVPGWVSGSDALFALLVDSADWGQRTRKMWDHEVLEPRLTASWRAESGRPLRPAILETMRRTLSDRYGVKFDSMGLNLYRDGPDSVARHGHRVAREIAEPIVALVSLGDPRRFLARPRGGGRRSRPFELGRGDLLVTGGTFQRRWEHSVPK